jgi:hypothetical protein
MTCSFRRHGFETKASRDGHKTKHEKPWKCDVEGCEFEKGGFLSRQMRDDHLERFHTPHEVPPSGQLENLDEADLRDVCLDLVRAGDVSKVRELAATGMLNAKPYLVDIVACAAQHASPEIVKILLSQKATRQDPDRGAWSGPYSKLLLPEAVAGNDSEMVQHILQSNPEDWALHLRSIHYSVPTEDRLQVAFKYWKTNGLPDVLARGTHEILDILCKWVEQDILPETTKAYLVQPNMVAATAGDAYREQILLGLWKKVPSQRWAKGNWKNAMLSVASTTCSIRLAKFLINQGVPVDWRNSKAVITPLVHAARKTTAEAAEFVRFLLFHGAETVVEKVIQRYDRKLQKRVALESQICVFELAGARGISKWLGITFEELVAQAKKARGEPENLDT